MNVSEPARRRGKSFAFESAWSQKLGAAARGLVLARERDWLLAWDAHHWLYLLDQAGQRQAQMRFTGALACASFADDGSAVVAVGSQGEIAWLAPDLMPRWRQSVPNPPLAVAVDSFGQFAAISDRAGNLTILDRLGQTTTTLQTPRPLHHLAFVPAEPVLLGCADLGLVICLELDGKVRWRDGLFANAGSLTASTNGSRILVACFSEGLQEYDLQGQKKDKLPVPEPCRWAALACTGQFILMAGTTSQRLLLLNAEGHTLASQAMSQEIAALALSPLGDRAAAALADGTVCQFRIQRS